MTSTKTRTVKPVSFEVVPRINLLSLFPVLSVGRTLSAFGRKTRSSRAESTRITHKCQVGIPRTQLGESSRRKQRGWLNLSDTVLLAFAATWVAGFVDATGWMLLSRIYTSNMTGNSISMSLYWLKGDWTGAAVRAWPVLMFVSGLVLGAVITEYLVRRGIESFSAVNLGIEAALLVAFIVIGQPVFGAGEIHASGWMFNLLVALLAFGMGMQNQTITRIGALSVHTTHVTGTLTRFGADVAKFIFWLRDRSHTPRRFFQAMRLSWRKKNFRDMLINLWLWIFFTIGAIAALFATEAWGTYGLIAPTAVLLGLIVADLLRPMMASAEAMEIAKSRHARH